MREIPGYKKAVSEISTKALDDLEKMFQKRWVDDVMKRSMTVKEIILTLWMMTFIMINKICLFSFEIREGLKRHWEKGKFHI